MATTNFTGDGSQRTVEQVYCSAALIAGLHGQLTFISALNTFLSITAFLGNALILAALRKESSLHLPSKLLLSSLATTDLCVGIISQPLFVAYLIFIFNGHWNICRYLLAAGYFTEPILCGVGFVDSDRNKRGQTSRPLVGAQIQTCCNFEENLRDRYYLLGYAHCCIIMLLLEFPFSRFVYNYSCCTVFSNLNVLLHNDFFKLRHHQNVLQDQAQQQNQTNPLNIVRYRKAVSTALWLQLTLVACYLPYGIVMALSLTYIELSSTLLAVRYTVTLLFVNSSLNPILYCWKIDEVRQAVKDTIRQVLCCSSS